MDFVGIFDWPDLLSSAVGSVIGAIAGGLIAYLLVSQASKETLRRDKEQRNSLDRLAALHVYFALSRTGNDTLSARAQVEEMLTRPLADPAVSFQTQRKLSAFAGMSKTVVNPFTGLDLSPFASPDGIEFLNCIDLLGRCYETQIQLFEDFRQLKLKFFEIFEASENLGEQNDLSTYVIQDQERSRLRVRERNAEIVAEGIVETVRRNSALVHKATLAYNSVAKGALEHLKLPLIDTSLFVERFPDLAEIS